MDYKKLGFRCGIEIHQQLETGKLFCNCRSIVHDNDPDIAFQRKLRAVAGETGEIDAAAAHEKGKDKVFRYEGCNSSACLVEMDEEPPHQMNQDALMIVIQAAKLFNAEIIDEVQVMRKTVVDGSNVSGFQRTALIAIDGFIETSKGRVVIPLICLEEEAAKKVKEGVKMVTYRLDRLGVPLIEVSTSPDIIDPDHAKECAEKIGMILRSTGKVKRGIGTIRQDVNISIKGGARTEIKGFQDLRSIPKVIESEIRRQYGLLERKKPVEESVRKAEPDGSTIFMRPMPGAARMYPETDVLPIRPGVLDVVEIELIEDKVTRYQESFGLGHDLAKKLARSEFTGIFERLIAQSVFLKGPFIAETLISAPREIRRKHGIDISGLGQDHYLEIFRLIDEGKVPKGSVLEMIMKSSQGKFDASEFSTIGDEDLRKSIDRLIKENPGKPFGAVMGMAMARFKGKADGKKVADFLKELIGKVQ